MLEQENVQLRRALKSLNMNPYTSDQLPGRLIAGGFNTDEHKGILDLHDTRMPTLARAVKDLGCVVAFGLHPRFPHLLLLSGMRLGPLKLDESVLWNDLREWNLRGVGPKLAQVTRPDGIMLLLQQDQLLVNQDAPEMEPSEVYEDNAGNTLSSFYLEDAILHFCNGAEEFLRFLDGRYSLLATEKVDDE